MATKQSVNPQLQTQQQFSLGPLTPRLVESESASEHQQLEIQKQVKTATQQAMAMLREYCPFGRHFF